VSSNIQSICNPLGIGVQGRSAFESLQNRAIRKPYRSARKERDIVSSIFLEYFLGDRILRSVSDV
jgi:hypothetical protein